jgi:hypothetical protein
MGNWGGARPDSGRKPGIGKAKSNIEKFLAAAEKKFGVERAYHPIQFAYFEMLNENNPLVLRLRIAKSLFPYFAPRLVSLDVNSEEDKHLTIEIKEFKRPEAIEQQQAIAAQVIDVIMEKEDLEEMPSIKAASIKGVTH